MADVSGRRLSAPAPNTRRRRKDNSTLLSDDVLQTSATEFTTSRKNAIHLLDAGGRVDAQWPYAWGGRTSVVKPIASSSAVQEATLVSQFTCDIDLVRTYKYVGIQRKLDSSPIVTEIKNVNLKTFLSLVTVFECL